LATKPAQAVINIIFAFTFIDSGWTILSTASKTNHAVSPQIRITLVSAPIISALANPKV
jgi:hypothetical protein